MVEQGDRKAEGAGSHGHLRASHADREQVINTLKAAFVQGRLTKQELDVRAGRVFAARTYADLAAITADLPAGLVAARPPLRPVVRRARPPARRALAWGACGFITPAILFAGLLSNNGVAWALFFPLAAIYFMAWMVAGAAILDSWHQQRSRGQLPPRPAQRRHAIEADPDGGNGDDLTLCESSQDLRSRHRPGHGVIKRSWRPLAVHRDRRTPDGLQVPA
jgi:Domain of unknown function (DUF1707)